MANISDASGTIYFKANTKETIKELFDLIKLMDDGSDFFTSYVHWGDCCRYITKVEDDYMYQLEISFIGSGRWSYYCNIERMFTWIKYHIDNYLDDIDKEKYTNMLVSIQNADWMINFDYIDYEPGCELFGNYCFHYIHEKGESLDSLIPYEGDCEEYELNIVNYAKYMNQTLDEALEEWYYKYDDSEELKEAIEEEKEAIENFVGKPFEEIIKSSYVLESLYKDTH